ncbi:adenylate/guanylate cyclase domain-containing protein [Haloferax massiliensis]|uniref:Adenylate cyclase 1 n=1 Tax=Haloferax massiliensis TaxID=1476858 RepID=A0A0D6JX54_9EURY|nr:adenylate/guanylate cyclase domain-containing protein [Haloferax massiliensis]CQR54106.1 Adenylate cyclase 1 [Haloferax massiliensis]
MAPQDENPDKSYFRMDFVQEIIDYEETEDGVVAKFAMVPNPDRYKKIETEEFQGYYDTLDKAYIPFSTIESFASQMRGTPIYHSSPEIDNTSEYIKNRKETIERFFEEEQEPPELIDASQELLQELADKNDTRFVILSIDIVGSTQLSQDLETEEYRKIIQLFFREISVMIRDFKGHVLDYQGDRVVAYFPDPNYTGMHDNSIDCASSIKKLILEGINPVLQSRDLPELHFRIGMDSGEADIVSIGASGVRGELSLFGSTINLASKIENQASEDEILLGEETERNLHTMWRQNTEQVTFDDWDYEKENGEQYRVYRLKY